MTHTIAIAAFDGVVPFDLATPCEVFGRARTLRGRSAYAIAVCGEPIVDAGYFALRPTADYARLHTADTVIVPGMSDIDRAPDPRLLDALETAARRGARVASICTGAFVLAAAGLLDGKRATTHWLAAPALAERYPAIAVDPHVLYIDEDSVLSSAGAAAGLDLCLHLVRRDYGAEVAAATARISVMPLERPGGQAQFMMHPPPAGDGSSLQPLLRWAVAHLTEDLSVVRLARQAAVSPRTLVRRFAAQVGTTPARWVRGARVRRAQELLETSDLGIERIAEAGLGTGATLRAQFRAVLGTSPSQYRRAFDRRSAPVSTRPRQG